jgi:hypothetical protein
MSTFLQKVRPIDRLAPLQQLLRSVQILRLRRPLDPEAAQLEKDVRARIRAIRGLPPEIAPQAPTQLELPFVDLPPPRPSRKRSRRKSG